MKLHHIALTVNDLNESKDFYCNNFGFKEINFFERPDLKGKATFLQLGDVRLELWQFEDIIVNNDDLGDIKIRGIRHIAFAVENLDSTIKQLEDKGLTFRKPTLGASGHRYSFTTDPNGIAIEVYEV